MSRAKWGLLRGTWRTIMPLVIALSVATVRADGPMPNSVPTVMDRRWAFATAYGAATMRPRSTETKPLFYGTLQLSVRFRPIDVLELGAVFVGGGTFHYGQGLGGSTAANRFARPEGALRRSLRVGGGLERRFTSWAFASVLHLFAIGDNPGVVDMPGTAVEHLANSTVIGGSLSMFAIYYWGRGTRRHRAGRVP